MKEKRLYIIALALVFSLVAVGVYFVWKANFAPNMTVINAFDIPETRLVINGNWIQPDHPPVLHEGQILLSFDTIKQHIDPYIWYDEALMKVTITTKDRVIRMKTGSLNALVNEKPMELKFPAVDANHTIYLPIDFLLEFYNINVRYAPENDVVILDSLDKSYRIAYPVSAKTYIRRGMSIREPIVKMFESQNPEDITVSQTIENSLRIIDEYDEWYRVLSHDGALGYVKKDEVVITGTFKPVVSPTPAEPPKLTDGKINLVWDMTYSRHNIELSKDTTPGIDVISPTWFEIVDREGTIKNRATPEYMEHAHKNQWQVWALFSNNFGDIEGTSLILNNSDKRQEIIRNILAYAALYKLDGINIDFENMYRSDKDAFTQFVRELYPLAKEQGLYVSVDVTVPDGSDTWSKCYDRKALAESVDYICLMTYDQHWASSPKAGSTAELEWVEENLLKTLNEVPKEKLLLGIPLYTRLWIEEVIDGETKIASKALNITSAWDEIENNEAAVVWNDISGQYQSSFEKEGKKYYMWIEDSDAVNMKTSLVHKYDLAGACVWAANFADKEVFNIFQRNLKEVFSYDEWKMYYSQPSPQK
jgi:spore germination protein YaaH